MKATLTLFLKGAPFMCNEIEVPDVYPGFDFETNCFDREEAVREECQKLRIMYLRQIIKCGHEYEIRMTIGSKMNKTKWEKDYR